MFNRSRFFKSEAAGNRIDKMTGNTDTRPLSSDLKENLEQIRQKLGHSPDVKIREFEIASKFQAAVVFIDNLSDKKLIDDFVMRSLMTETAHETLKNMASDKNILEFIINNALTIGEVQVIKDWNGLMFAFLSGETVILIDGSAEAISGDTRGGGGARSVTEPSSQVVIRGPKDGFIESIATNVSLIRHRIKSPDLWLEPMIIGKVTRTAIAIMYMKGIANDQVVQEVKKRLNDIKIDGILESGNIEELIQDHPYSPFPTVFNTERPDAVVANLLEGRIAVLVDGTPFALILPVTFFMFFQSVEDYYQRFDIGITIRLLRYVSLFISLLGPSIYIAAITFHQEMIPTPLLISLAAQREGVPFPAFVEAFLMETSFEILREAGVRMPRAIGQAVSIVGALVLGQAAVQAGIISSAMVIVVAITGIASFVTPAFNMAISVRLLRFLLMFFAASFGFYGIAIIMIVITAHLCSLRSFGIPYMAPLAPFIPADQKDAVLRLPLWTFLTRPRLISQKNMTRMKPDLKPMPPEQNKAEGNKDES
ncbi:spore germination protein [Paenibacillus sp. sptzw28]|uniref:spore germination protein n=1 Tax=Paenibacillus sp. sptzw28 TaxID=715179 RepID=UPI001C6E9CB2|nr:spore germination protein [Paenibacillus sp. sptzw28]QYR22754.1 spore germination protein [Paenibacillus sp. sptzw28]